MNAQITDQMLAAVPKARKLAGCRPRTPVRLAAREVASAFLALMRVKEMPVSQECTGPCGERKSLSAFVTFRKVRVDGTPYEYTSTQCKACKAAKERQRAAKRNGAPRAKKFSDGVIIRPAKVARSVEEQAVQIADAAGNRRIQVIRESGHVAWQRVGAKVPDGAELIGVYDAGSDRRDIYADLTA